MNSKVYNYEQDLKRKTAIQLTRQWENKFNKTPASLIRTSQISNMYHSIQVKMIKAYIYPYMNSTQPSTQKDRKKLKNITTTA